MITTSSCLTRLRRRLRLTAVSVPTILGLALLSGTSAHAKPIPSNLGNGLDKLVANHLAMTNAAKSGAEPAGTVHVNGKAYVDEVTAAVASSALSDKTGRVLVRITLNGEKTAAQMSKDVVASAASVTVTAIDPTYRSVGVMNAYVDVADVAKLASTPGVAAVILEWRPRHNTVFKAPAQPTGIQTSGGTFGPGAGTATDPAAIQNVNSISPAVGETIAKIGTTFDQGVTQHGIDQINKLYNPGATLDLEGQGMQIACISNSFAANANGPETTDVTNGDLPGPGGLVNTTPVYVLQDDLSSSTSDDEGRGMCQIVFKMAPKATIAFATADTGEVGFANNIRGLGGLAGYTNNGQTFAADTICDDVGYSDEPFFQDGIISAGIEAVAAAGVSYFSSAANDIGTNGYDSDTRWVANGTGTTAAAGNTALANTNIDLTNVPAALYAGGFHNFNPSGLDVAQTVNIGGNNAVPIDFQWNDPYDQNTAATGVTQFYSGGGTYTNAAVLLTVPVTVTQGTKYQFVETANGDGFDAIITVYKSDGVTVIIGPQDTGVDETVRFSAPANDTGFVVKVDHYSTTTGAFTVTGSSFTGFTTPPVSTSISVLAFNVTTGAYIPASSVTADATTTNEPIQLGYTNRPTGATQIQLVFARSMVPAAGFNYPTHLRYLYAGNGRAGYGPAEYFTYNTVTTGGHAMSPSCNGCAAYSVFRPSLPETFTSPGPVTIYYDTNDNRLNPPQVRLQPRVAFADGANVSAVLSTGAGFASDNGSDPDTTQGQFFGTSATGPHGAAIAALVLQNKGGRRSVTPAQMTSLLERSTTPHDLDPNFSSGSARVTGGTSGTGKIAVTISSDGSAGSATNGQGLGDTTSFTVSYVGGSSVTAFTFNSAGTLADGGVSGGNNGVTYNSPDATIGGTTTYFENSLPGVVFLTATKAFTLNTTLSDSVTGAVGLGANPNGANGTQYLTLNITVPSGNFTSASKLRFTVGRGLAFSSAVTGTGSNNSTVVNATSGAAFYSADIFGGGVILPEATVVTTGMPFSGTTADGGTFSGTIRNVIGSGWAKTDGYGFVNAVTAVGQTVQ